MTSKRYPAPGELHSVDHEDFINIKLRTFFLQDENHDGFDLQLGPLQLRPGGHRVNHSEAEERMLRKLIYRSSFTLPLITPKQHSKSEGTT